MRILHTSDLHGRYKRLLAEASDFDIWVDTGDFFPNRGRVPQTGMAVISQFERRHQLRWLRLKNLPDRLARWLRGRPAICVPGNHDFIDLGAALRSAGANATSLGSEPASVCGLKWDGFREIPWMAGEWPGEAIEFDPIVRRATMSCPDVLCTHAPPKGILDGSGSYGIPALADAVNKSQSIRLHLFGHEHEDGGSQVQVGGVLFSNAATCLQVVKLSPRA